MKILQLTKIYSSYQTLGTKVIKFEIAVRKVHIMHFFG